MDERQIYEEASKQLAEERELAEKENNKIAYEEKPQIIEQGKITNEEIQFVFFNNKLIFEESKSNSSRALISGTFMMLNEPSYNKNFYDISEFENIEESFRGLPVYYGIKWDNTHDFSKPSIGFVTGVRRMGKRVFGVVSITNKKIIEALKRGVRYVFSVAGFASSFETVKIKNKVVRKLRDITIRSLQLLPLGTKIGFDSARMDKLLNIQETVSFFGDAILNIGLNQVLESEELNRQILEVAGIIE